MNWTILLRKLIAIEHMIGKADADTLRNLVCDAQDCLIQMQSAEEKRFFEDALRPVHARLQLVGSRS